MRIPPNHSPRIAWSSHVFAACFATLLLAPLSPIRSQTVTVTLDRHVIDSVSQFQGGDSQIDNSLDYPWTGNDQTAVNSARSVLANSAAYVNQHIMGWGVGDPWPDSSQSGPTAWSGLDTHMTILKNTGRPICITLCEAPWWMKGALNSDGSTTLLTSADEWSSIAYGSRILDNKMNSWLTLVQKVAERYMVAPYNVRTFQVWNELKGYWDPRSGKNHWDYDNSAGDPSGPNAKHGYTFMYNQVYNKLISVAQNLGISTSELKIGGPYVVMDTYSSASKMSNPSNVTGPWGVVDQRTLDVITYWLANKTGGQFVTVDGGNVNKDGTEITDTFTRCEKFSTINNWIRQQPSGATIPIWWAEWYTYNSGLTNNDQTNRAVGAYSAMQQIISGASTPLIWGGTASSAAAPPLYTATTTSGGGQATPWAGTYQNLNTYFNPGTPIFHSNSSSGNIAVLAGDTRIMLINKQSTAATVSMQGVSYSLAGYDVQFVNSALYQAENLTVANYHSAAGGTVRVLTADTSLSASQGSILDSNNIGDYVTYLLPNIAAGTYDVRIGVKNFTARGQFQLEVGRADNFGGSSSNVGPVIDEYASTATYTEVDLGSWSPGSTSDKWFRFNVVGKNASSGGSSYNYALAFDYIVLTPH
jgi:hypothetical protein